MTRRILLASLLATVSMAVGSGCCTDHLHGGRGGYGPLAGGVAYHPCDTCGGGGCAQCVAQTPREQIGQLVTCGAGCGEVYWDEWISDPPNCCDPCNNCNHWVGYQSCGPRWRDAWRNLWGYRFDEACFGPLGKYGGLQRGQIIADEREIPAGAVIYSSQTTTPMPAVPQRSALKRTTINSTPPQPYYAPAGPSTRVR